MFQFPVIKNVRDDLDNHNYPAPATIQIFRMHSYAELMSWVRRRATKFYIADLEVSACDVQKQQHEKGSVNALLLYDDEGFERLRTDTEYKLKVKSLSKPFSAFVSYDSIRAYAKLERDFTSNCSMSDDFPKVKDTKMLAAHSRLVTSILVSIMEYCGNDPDSEMFSRDIISPFWRQAVAISNAELSETKSTVQSPTSVKIPAGRALDQLRYEFETPVEGRRAHGTLDMIVYLQYSIFPLLVAKDITVTVINGRYQALAQMVAARDRVVRYYSSQYPLLGEAQVKAVYDKYPSFGVVSSGQHWFLLKYYKNTNGVWEAEQSQWITLMCIAPKNKAQLKFLRLQTERLLQYLSGASMLLYQQVLELEQMFAEMNAGASVKRDEDSL